VTGGFRSYRSVALGVGWRTAHNALTTPNLVIPSLAFPLFFFVAFAGGLSQLSHLPGFNFAPGYTAFQFVFVMLQSAAFGGVFTVFGLYALAALVNTATVLWAAGIAMRFRTIQAGPAMQMPVFLALFFAPVYVPLALLSGWIHTIAQGNPVTYFLESGRGFISADPVHVGLAFSLAVLIAAGFSLWAFRGLRKAEAAGG